jgi:hypothetical protein
MSRAAFVVCWEGSPGLGGHKQRFGLGYSADATPMAVQRLYLDESGDHCYRGIAAAQWDKYLCLFGCSLDVAKCHAEFNLEFEHLKSRHFGGDPDDPVICHREDMRARRGCFAILRDQGRAEAFHKDLGELIKKTNFCAFAVVIDKLTTQTKTFGPLPYHPYHVGLLALLERYCGWLNFTRQRGDVLAEGRGGTEDLQLKAAYAAVHSAGTRFRRNDFFQKALTTKEIKIKPKTQNIPGLQLADLFAYPAKRQILYAAKLAPEPTGFTKTMAAWLESKYNTHYYDGRVWGYGKVFLG